MSFKIKKSPVCSFDYRVLQKPVLWCFCTRWRSHVSSCRISDGQDVRSLCSAEPKKIIILTLLFHLLLDLSNSLFAWGPSRKILISVLVYSTCQPPHSTVGKTHPGKKSWIFWELCGIAVRTWLRADTFEDAGNESSQNGAVCKKTVQADGEKS